MVMITTSFRLVLIISSSMEANELVVTTTSTILGLVVTSINTYNHHQLLEGC